MSQLSEASQNYLKAIWTLQEWSDVPVTPTALAAKAGVKLSTASDAVRRLTEQGLIEHAPYGQVVLTDIGRSYEVAMVRRHRLIESFLVEVLHYTWDQVHDEAEVLEHAVSDFMIARIDEHLGRPAQASHGDPIPAADGTWMRPDAVPLSDVTPDSTVVVARISDADPRLLQFFADHGVRVGSKLTVRPGAAFSDSVEIEVAGAAGAFALGMSGTDAVWVTTGEATAS